MALCADCLQRSATLVYGGLPTCGQCATTRTVALVVPNEVVENFMVAYIEQLSADETSELSKLAELDRVEPFNDE